MTIQKISKKMGLIALLFCMTMIVRAQDKQMPTAGTRASKMTEWMKTNLSLTADQAAKVQDLNMKYAVKMDSVRNTGQARQDTMTSMKSDDAARDEELKGILTDDQFKAYQSKKQEMKGKYKEKMKDQSQGQDQ